MGLSRLLIWRIFFILALASPLGAFAQTCSGGTCTANSCSETDVQNLLNTITSTAPTNNVAVIPGGSCSWGTQWSWTVPTSLEGGFTLKGATAITFSGTPATSSYACGTNDSNYSTCSNGGTGGTIITDGTSGGGTGHMFEINIGGGSSCHFTIEGLTIVAGTPEDNGVTSISGSCYGMRYTQNHLLNTGGQSGIAFFGNLEGVIDHSVSEGGGGPANAYLFYNDIADSIGYGDGTWTNPTDFGGQDFIFLENNISNGGLFEDCDLGGKFVARYNNVLNGSSASAVIHQHGTKSPGGRNRGCRAYEAYHNYINNSSGHDAAIGSAGGPSLVWGNDLNAGYNWLAAIAAPRNDAEECETANPNGWGFCGNNIPAGCSTPANSNWDGNTNSTGYPCLDGLGRGQGTQALNGQNFPNALNSSTGTIAFPQEYLEPIYYFMNSGSWPSGELRISDISTQMNRDVYIDNSSFNGSTGTGYGLLANRPSACTAGPGGTYGQSPTGSYGVAYFANDANGGAGELYICTASGSPGTWTPVYQPYTYPHPLDGGTSACATPIQLAPYSGNYNYSSLPFQVQFSSPTPGCNMFGTTDGSAPTCSSTAYPSGGWTVSTAGTFVFRVIACQAGFTPSIIWGGTWTVSLPPPTVSPSPGVLNAPASITLSTTWPSSTIYYTTDGSTPTHSSPVYSSPIPLTWATTTTINSITTASGYTDSTVTSAVYTVVSEGPQSVIHATSTGTSNATTMTFTVAIGDALIVGAYDGNGTSRSVTFSDSFGSVYNQVATVNLASHGATEVMDCAITPTSGSVTITINAGSDTAIRGVAYEAKGTLCTPPLAAAVTSNTTGASACTSGPITTSATGLLVGMCGTDGSQTTMTAGSGWTNAQLGSNAGAAYILGETQGGLAGTYTATSGSFSGTAEQATILGAFSPSSTVSLSAPTISGVIQGAKLQ